MMSPTMGFMGQMGSPMGQPMGMRPQMAPQQHPQMAQMNQSGFVMNQQMGFDMMGQSAGGQMGSNLGQMNQMTAQMGNLSMQNKKNQNLGSLL